MYGIHFAPLLGVDPDAIPGPSNLAARIDRARALGLDLYSVGRYAYRRTCPPPAHTRWGVCLCTRCSYFWADRTAGRARDLRDRGARRAKVLAARAVLAGVLP